MQILMIDKDFDSTQLPDHLRKLYDTYLLYKDRQSTFSKFKHLRLRNVDEYINKCQQLCRSVKYVSFRKDRLTFVVRIQSKQINVNLGTYEAFDDACECLRVYLEERYRLFQQEEVSIQK